MLLFYFILFHLFFIEDMPHVVEQLVSMIYALISKLVNTPKYTKMENFFKSIAISLVDKMQPIQNQIKSIIVSQMLSILTIVEDWASVQKLILAGSSNFFSESVAIELAKYPISLISYSYAHNYPHPIHPPPSTPNTSKFFSQII
jgi:hypothetical protein